MGVVNAFGSGEMGVTRSDLEALNTLKALAEYRAATVDSLVFF